MSFSNFIFIACTRNLIIEIVSLQTKQKLTKIMLQSGFRSILQFYHRRLIQENVFFFRKMFECGDKQEQLIYTHLNLFKS